MPRPGKVTDAIGIRKWGSGGSGGPSGDATARYKQTTTATPKDGSDGEDFGEVLVTEQGPLEGFDDGRGGVRQFLDMISGRQSTASLLNNQLALGRDTTAQQLQNQLAVGEQSGRQALALGQQGNEARLRELEMRLKGEAINADRVFNNEMTKLGISEDAARNLQRDSQQHAEKLESIRNSNMAEVEKQKALNNAEADFRKARIDLAAKNNLPLDQLDKASNMLVTSFLAGQTAVQDASGAASAQSKQATALANRMTMAINQTADRSYLASHQANLDKQASEDFQKRVIKLEPNQAAFFAGGPDDNSIRFTGSTPAEKDAVGRVTSPAVPAQMDVMKVLSGLQNAGVTQPMFGRGPAAAGQPTTAKPAGVTPQPQAAAQPPMSPEATGIIPGVGSALSSLLQPLGPIGQAGYSTVRGIGDLIYKYPQGSPELAEKEQFDATMYDFFQKIRNSKLTGGLPKNSTATPLRSGTPSESGTELILDPATGYLRSPTNAYWMNK